MFYNYLKIAVRNFFRNKMNTLVNVAGLALGIGSVVLISLYIRYETGYDKYYDGYENLYRITWENENPQTRTPHPMAQAMVDDFPEVESAVSLSPIWAAGLTRETFSIRNPETDTRFDVSNILAVDTTFFDVFRFPVVKGDGRKALRNTNAILISESAAKKYFGDEDPIGKQLAVYPDSILLEVMAVFKDVPRQSHIQFEYLVSYLREKTFEPDDEYYKWGDFGHYNYVRLKPGVDPKALEAKLLSWIRKYIDITDEQFTAAMAANIGFRVQPVTDIHLKSHLRWELESNGNIEYVYIMAAAALLTLLIACINFMNLMTAKSTERAKEIGIRKTMGAVRRQLSFQFLSEAVILSLASVVVALFLVEGALPLYNSFTGHSVTLEYIIVLPVLLLLGLVVGILSGLYPSLVLSAIQPHSIIKGKFQNSAKGNRLRSALIVFQFAISMILISGSAIIFSQLDFIRNKDLGFDSETLLVVPLKGEALSDRMNALKTELLKVDGVSSVSASSNMPGGQFNQNSVSTIDKPEHQVSCSEVFVDHDFIKTMNIELAEGLFFQEQNFTDTAFYFVINETAAKQLNVTNLVGSELNWYSYDDDRPVKGRLVGIIKDFHFQSLHEPLRPLLMVMYPAYNHLIVKLNTQNLNSRMTEIERVYRQFDHDFDFEFSFLDQRLNKQYETEARTGIMFGFFAGIAIAIACFGLFAMAMLTYAQRNKEISVRKVLGASFSSLVVLLLSDFTRLILLSIVLAIPVAWWGMHRWLDNFIYKVAVRADVFVVSALILLAIAWLTLGYLTLKTSRLNPAETLKNE